MKANKSASAQFDKLLSDQINPEKQRSLKLSTGKMVGAAQQTVRLISFAAAQTSSWSSADAARALALNPSTCFNLIQTLLTLGWLSKAETSGRNKRYMLGSDFVNLVHGVAVRKVDLRELMPYLQDFADRWKVTATVWHRQSLTRMELVAIASCQTAINVQMPIGQRLPILMGGMGRVMALQAGLDSGLREELFETLRWDRSLTYEQFMSQARRAKRLGWGVDDGFMNRSVTALAVPVRDSRSKLFQQIGSHGNATERQLTEQSDAQRIRRPQNVQDAPGDVQYVCSATMFRHQYSSTMLPELARMLIPVAAEAARIIFNSR